MLLRGEGWRVVDWVLLVFHMLVSCLPVAPFRLYINGVKGFNSLIFIKTERKSLVSTQDKDYYNCLGMG